MFNILKVSIKKRKVIETAPCDITSQGAVVFLFHVGVDVVFVYLHSVKNSEIAVDYLLEGGSGDAEVGNRTSLHHAAVVLLIKANHHATVAYAIELVDVVVIRVLIALSATAADNEQATLALKQLSKLKGSQVHSSVILSSADKNIFKKLHCDVTNEPKSI